MILITELDRQLTMLRASRSPELADRAQRHMRRANLNYNTQVERYRIANLLDRRTAEEEWEELMQEAEHYDT